MAYNKKTLHAKMETAISNSKNLISLNWVYQEKVFSEFFNQLTSEEKEILGSYLDAFNTFMSSPSEETVGELNRKWKPLDEAANREPPESTYSFLDVVIYTFLISILICLTLYAVVFGGAAICQLAIQLGGHALETMAGTASTLGGLTISGLIFYGLSRLSKGINDRREIAVNDKNKKIQEISGFQGKAEAKAKNLTPPLKVSLITSSLFVPELRERRTSVPLARPTSQSETNKIAINCTLK